ncbi:nSTAND3 domain-containing NTPase [Sphingobacterium siyangense]|uniref:nSTAND3 domain-containing NTPase n=1 Tax=Sphingobacterium siyangense TaxID=459529 RepID=UPI0031F761B0
MPEYSFLNLSPPEFENLTRNLLQKHLNLTLESFTSGRDNGIDLRYSTQKGKKIIIQCKRYKNYASLISNLKKEVKKVHKLVPDQYIISTSVGLNPDQKKAIKNLFAPYIFTESDIYGNEDINNLLGLYPTIEEQHFKLWLASTNVLERILNSNIYNQSNFELEKIRETINVYVDNKSYYEAKKIIQDKSYVIISGIPGIGKTTLAQILIYHYLASGFNEFIYLSESVAEGFKAYKEGVKQIFMFDDFLGTNFLENKLNNNEDQRIIKFIEKISNAKDKIFILTTREYILAQAKQKYASFDKPSIEFAKCILDLAQYTKLVRAKILYNHLFFSNLSEGHLLNLLNSRTYLQIIEHPNYNPRIIETITHDDVWQTIAAHQFATKFLEFIKNPTSVWQHVFENQISKLSQCILGNLMTAGTPIFLKDLQRLAQNFAKVHGEKYGVSCNEMDFKKSLRELENTFIKLSRSDEGHVMVEYQNPSVQDFLVFHYQEMPDSITDLIISACFLNQFYRVFSIREESLSLFRKNKIKLNNKQIKQLRNKIISDYDELTFSEIKNNILPLRRTKNSEYIKIEEICDFLDLEEDVELRAFIIERFEQVMYPGDMVLDYSEMQAYASILEHLRWYMELDAEKVLGHVSESIYDKDDLQQFERIGDLFGDHYYEIVFINKGLRNRIKAVLEIETENTDQSDWESQLNDIIELAKKYNIDYTKYKRKIEDKYLESEDEESDSDDWRKKDHKRVSDDDISNGEIIELFESLRTEKGDE